MINLLPQCNKCGLPVTDSLEYEIEQHEKIKTGNYINGVWICDDCSEAEKKQKEYSLSHTNQNNNSNNQCDNIELASKSDVSPNTPRADET
jgi:predicted RNA-binding protein YlxR (DUF448 family)